MTWHPHRFPVPEGPGRVRVNLGCGLDYRDGWVNVDWNPTGELRVDKSFNLEETPWPFEANTVDYVLMSHVVEHVRHDSLFGVTRRLLGLMKEARRTGRWDDREVAAIERLAAQDGLVALMEETHRILKPAGLMDVICPGPWTPDAWRDPTHARAVEPDFWTYFGVDALPTRQFYSRAKFRLVRQEFLRTLDFRAPFRWLHFKDYHADKYLRGLGGPLKRLGVKRWHYTRLAAVK